MNLNWIPIVWPTAAGAILALATIHLLVWTKNRAAWANLFFCLAAAAMAGLAFFELWMMQAETPGQFGTALRWLHVPAWVIVVSLTGFVLAYLRAGRLWLAWTICAVGTFSLMVNFLVGQNLDYREVTRLRHIPFFGESVSVAEGVANPWMWVGQLTLLLLVVFVVDAAITVWRRGERRQALVTAGSIVFVVLVGTVQALLVLWEDVQWPLTVSLFFMPFIVAMSYEMSRTVLQASWIAAQLEKSEIARHQIERRLDEATEAAEIGTWEWDIVRDEIWLTNQGRAIFGFDPAQRIDFDRMMSVVHPEDRAAMREAVTRSLQEGGTCECEYRRVSPEGKECWIMTRSRVEVDADGRAILLRGVSMDITKRKQGERLLEQERAFLRQVIDIVPHLIFAKDRQGRFTLVNQAVADIYGTTVDALIGKTDADFDKNAAEVENFRRMDLEVMDTLRERFIPEENITDAAGKVHYMQTVKRPIVGTDQRADQVLGSATDITARKQAELELERERNELAHLSRVTMLGELSGSLAHELNQPLAAILSNAQAALRFLAEDRPNLDEVREILTDIVYDDKRAGDVIGGLRLMLKKGERRRELVDMNDVVRNVLRLMNSDLVNAGVTLTTGLAPGLPRVTGDEVQLQQVVLNLLVNGCDAMAGTAVAERQLVVSTELRDQCVRVLVADQGRGIREENLERVFEPFFTTKEHGLGLGLAVCRQIMVAHGGRLWATNNARRGATLCLTLPANSASTA